MSSSTIQFISQVKLGELRRQRSMLLAAYDQIAQQAGGLSSVEGLRALFEGLKSVKVAGRLLHPDLGNLELLLQGAGPSQEVLAFWRRRLEAELETGRLRADIVYLFGALLGEWGDEDTSRQAFLEERRQAYATLLQQVLTPPAVDEARTQALLDEIFASLGSQLQEARARLAQTIEESAQEAYHVAFNLSSIAESIYQPAAIRQEARRFLKDRVLNQELMAALAVVTRDLRSWSWPEDGVASRSLWTRNKWRLYLELSLVQLGIVHSFGSFWSQAIQQCYTDVPRKVERMNRYHKLVELKAPDLILQNELRMLERADIGWYEPLDPWDGAPSLPAQAPVRGIVSERAAAQKALREIGGGGGYYQGHGGNRMVQLVHAEVRTLRAAFPDRPLFIGKLDIRAYYPSIPHHVLLRMLYGLGLPERDVQAIGRYLAVPYRVDDRIAPARRGVPLDLPLSRWLAEWLLRLMERYVHSRARVRILRQVDDICLLAPSAADLAAAWQAVHHFLEACGLESNDDKSGACALGAERPAGLPAARWGLLELTEEGDWAVHEPTFQTFCADTRTFVTDRRALLAQVTHYNAHLRYLSAGIGLALDLGEAHRRSVNEALRRFAADFYAPGVSIVAGLKDALRARSPEGAQLPDLPESWIYWPVTAGGLGLRSVLVLSGQYQQAFEERKKNRVPVPPTRPDDWQQGDTRWSAFYSDQLKQLPPARPTETQVMKALVEDFIARGQEISGGEQQGLSDYWRWVLSIYGPQILDRLGTFRFLLTDLVPLQLIQEQLLHDSSFEE